MRVRQILSSLDSASKAELKKLLPIKPTVPEATTAGYPSMLLNQLPKEESYALLGHIAEHLLRLPHASITVDALLATTKLFVPDLTEVSETKIRASKTTQPFLDCLITTRKGVESVLREGPVKFEEEVSVGHVSGHPDMYTTTQVFEMKLTGMLKENWVSFLYQVFAYGALMPTVKDLYLVLPLQKMVWHASIGDWDERADYLAVLEKAAKPPDGAVLETMLHAQLLVHMYGIGTHTGKQKTLVDTVAGLGDYRRPYQIFLGGPQNSKMNVKDSDLALTAALIGKTKASIYVHSQYLINLSNAENDDWHVKLLIENLGYTRAFGGKGVVVHVGKSTKQSTADALQKMRTAITKALPHASEDCPLLLETPAGQGTETLCKMDEFIEFVESFKDPRLRVCLDTCHVFACGHPPLAYIDAVLKRPSLLKLVHYNDSLGECGSCVDRHAFVGSGKIGLPMMTEIAKVCTHAGLPMIIE
jgi:deoxyribonuclease-4